LNNLAMELHHQGKLDEADAVLQEALSIERKLLTKEHPLIASSLDMLAYVRLWQRSLEESERLYREALTMRRKLHGNEHLKVADALNNLAVTITARGRLAQGKLAEAEPLLLSGYEGMKQREHQIPPDAMGRLVEANERLVHLYELNGRADKAAEWKEQQALSQSATQSAPEVAARRASGI